MRLPVIRGLIDRRILVNYRVDPDVLEAIVPPPFRPQLVHGYGMAGICLIRLRHVRPKGVPAWLGISSENAAHRFAVEWEAAGVLRHGVYVMRRDTSCHLNALAGGRLFPGIHHHASFQVSETDNHFEIRLESDDQETSLEVVAELTDTWPNASVFDTPNEVSQFFEAGSLGYSPTSNPSRFQGLELRCQSWQTSPLSVTRVRSSFFDDPAIFPRGSIELDNALLMRGIDHEWHGQEDLFCHWPSSAGRHNHHAESELITASPSSAASPATSA